MRVRDGRVMAGDEPCRLFRVSGYRPETPEQVTAYFPDLTTAGAGEAGPVFDHVATELAAAGWAESSRWPYAYARFADGVPIPPIARTLHRSLGPGAARFGDPFTRDAPDGFVAWLAEPVNGTPITRLGQLSTICART